MIVDTTQTRPKWGCGPLDKQVYNIIIELNPYQIVTIGMNLFLSTRTYTAVFQRIYSENTLPVDMFVLYHGYT